MKAVNKVLDDLSAEFKKNMPKSSSMAIDEILLRYKGRFGSKQFNKSKPARLGILLRALCTSENNYCISLFTHSSYEKYHWGPVFNKLLSDLNLYNKTIYTDNLYTIRETINEVTKRKGNFAGTMREN